MKVGLGFTDAELSGLKSDSPPSLLSLLKGGELFKTLSRNLPERVYLTTWLRLSKTEVSGHEKGREGENSVMPAGCEQPWFHTTTLTTQDSFPHCSEPTRASLLGRNICFLQCKDSCVRHSMQDPESLKCMTL